MTVSRDDVVFAFDFSRIETVGGVRYLWDYGPNGFHFAFAGGATDPTPQLDGSLLFTGGQRLELPAAQLSLFYSKVPTKEHTWLFAAYCSSGTLFSTYSVVNNGIFILHVANRIRIYQGQGAALPFEVNSLYAMTSGAMTVAATVEAAPRVLVNGSSDATTWPAGPFGTATFNVAAIPTIGASPGGGSAMTGRQYYLALIRGAISSPDLAFYSRLLAEGVRPWCVR